MQCLVSPSPETTCPSHPAVPEQWPVTQHLADLLVDASLLGRAIFSASSPCDWYCLPRDISSGAARALPPSAGGGASAVVGHAPIRPHPTGGPLLCNSCDCNHTQRLLPLLPLWAQAALTPTGESLASQPMGLRRTFRNISSIHFEEKKTEAQGRKMFHSQRSRSGQGS